MERVEGRECGWWVSVKRCESLVKVALPGAQGGGCHRLLRTLIIALSGYSLTSGAKHGALRQEKHRLRPIIAHRFVGSLKSIVDDIDTCMTSLLIILIKSASALASVRGQSATSRRAASTPSSFLLLHEIQFASISRWMRLSRRALPGAP